MIIELEIISKYSWVDSNWLINILEWLPNFTSATWFWVTSVMQIVFQVLLCVPESKLICHLERDLQNSFLDQFCPKIVGRINKAKSLTAPKFIACNINGHCLHLYNKYTNECQNKLCPISILFGKMPITLFRYHKHI